MCRPGGGPAVYVEVDMQTWWGAWDLGAGPRAVGVTQPMQGGLLGQQGEGTDVSTPVCLRIGSYVQASWRVCSSSQPCNLFL